jgi:beta-mannosidase
MTAAAFLILTAAPSLPERLALEGEWQLTQSAKGISIPARVPGTVHVDLLREKKIPDPFYRDGDRQVQWVGEVPWTYARKFKVPEAFLKHRRIILRAEGLDTLGRVLVNGQEVGRPDNMFRTWEYDVRPFLNAGENTIKIDFEPIEPFLKAHEVQAEFPGKPVQSHGWGYVRKPPYQQGWDFAPKLITAGIWRNIGLLGWDEARLTDVEIVQDHRASGEVGLDIKVEADTHGVTTALTTLLFKGRKIAETTTPIQRGQGKTRFTVAKPQLWWPVGMGAQPMYDVRVELKNAQGQVVDKGARRIGLRTVKWIQKTDKNPLALTVNGRRFFAKGSNWVPADALVVRATADHERKMIQKAVDNNFNMIRLWGGGHYESDAFFDACDEKGLLVWYEFKYACATYPAFDPKWLANIRTEAVDQVRRVRHHPSITVWSGNNEVIGFITDKTTPSSMSREDYELLFHQTLRDVVHETAPDAAYTPGSPEIGDDHYWNVWHGSATFASYRDLHGFMSEYGFQAFPVPRSVEEFTLPEDRTSVVTPVMKNHQRNWRDGNSLILNTMIRAYRRPKDFDSTLWLSQIHQADGVLMGVEHWRRDWPNSTGSLVWQFNDCWPSVSWSMVDYYGRPKALLYRLKHAYAPIALSALANAETGRAELWVATDRAEAKTGRYEWSLMRTDGTLVEKGSGNVRIPAGTSAVRAIDLDQKAALERHGAPNLLLWAKLAVPGEPDSMTVAYYAKPKELTLVDPGLNAKIVPIRGGYEVTLSSAKPALWSWIDFAGMDAEFSDNFVHLAPGDNAKIFVKPSGRTSVEGLRKALKVRSLFDTFEPGSEPDPFTRPEADGRIILIADMAEIPGNSPALEIGAPSNLGAWYNAGDVVSWSVKGAKPGGYDLVANVSIPADEAGTEFTVDVDGSRVTGKVPPTKGWTDYVDVNLGRVRVSKEGTIQVVLNPTKKPHGHVMNLRSLTLTPIK